MLYVYKNQEEIMRFLSRKLVMLGQLNSANRLFGGASLLCRVDKKAFIFAKCQSETPYLVAR
jgi:acyl-CoA hydrolase